MTTTPAAINTVSIVRRRTTTASPTGTSAAGAASEDVTDSLSMTFTGFSLS